jgi:hypothetical protein
MTSNYILVAISQKVISVRNGQLYEQMKLAESNVASHELSILHFLNYIMKLRNRFYVAVTYIRKSFWVQISLKHMAKQEKSSWQTHKQSWLWRAKQKYGL